MDFTVEAKESIAPEYIKEYFISCVLLRCELFSTGGGGVGVKSEVLSPKS